MKHNFSIPAFLLIAVLAVTSCKKDKDEDQKNDLIGTWNTETVVFNTLIGSKTLTQYFTEDLGLPAADAATYATMFNAGLQQQFTGTIQIKSDYTYTTNFGGQNDSGTWTLNPDATQLTIDSNTGEPMVIDVQRLTSDELKLHWTETGSEDLNEDNIPEAITADVTMTLSKM